MSLPCGLPSSPVLLLALPMLGGCVIPEAVGDALATSDGSGSGPGGGDATASEGPGATSLDEGTSAGAGTATAQGSSEGSSESGAMLGPCDDPQVIPPPPVDCSGADGVIAGSVIIGEGGTDDPSILEGVRRVEGSLRIYRTDLTNLDFMACVEEVGADVTIFGNEQLVDVGGLWSLSDIGEFVFSSNDAIEVFDGLPNLVSIPGSVVVRENASLRRLDGFHRFVGLDGMGIDPETGEVIGGNLTIQENPVLERIDGLLGMMVIHGRWQVISNPMLCVTSVISVIGCIVDPAQPDQGWCSLVQCYDDC
jgi:hypothetical protein